MGEQMTDLHKDQTRGWKAQQLFDNDLLGEAPGAIESEGCCAVGSNALPVTKEGKEALWQL